MINGNTMRLVAEYGKGRGTGPRMGASLRGPRLSSVGVGKGWTARMGGFKKGWRNRSQSGKPEGRVGNKREDAIERGEEEREGGRVT